jgi:hypothetical protein
VVSLVDLAIWAVLATARPADVIRDRPRLEQVARVMADAVEAQQQIIPGDAGPHAEVLALAAVGSHESGWRATVGDCRRKGGPAIGYWQGEAWSCRPYTEAELCASPALQADRALHALTVHARQSRRSWGAVFRGYAGGDPRVESKAADEICRIWESLAARAGLSGVTCAARLPATWRAGA